MQVGIIQFQSLCRIPACILYLLVFKRQSLRKRSDIQLRKCSKSSDKLYSGTMFDFLQDSVSSSQYRFLSNSKSKFSLSLCYKHKLITNLWKGCINKQRWSKITLFWFCNNKHFEYCSTWRQVHHIQLDDFGDEVQYFQKMFFEGRSVWVDGQHPSQTSFFSWLILNIRYLLLVYVLYVKGCKCYSYTSTMMKTHMFSTLQHMCQFFCHLAGLLSFWPVGQWLQLADFASFRCGGVGQKTSTTAKFVRSVGWYIKRECTMYVMQCKCNAM